MQVHNCLSIYILYKHVLKGIFMYDSEMLKHIGAARGAEQPWYFVWMWLSAMFQLDVKSRIHKQCSINIDLFLQFMEQERKTELRFEKSKEKSKGLHSSREK